MDFEPRESEDYFGPENRFVVELTSDDFDSTATWRLKNHRCSIVLFYAPWCPHCKALKDVWVELARRTPYFTVAAFNCEKNDSHLSKIKADMPALIRGYPTLIIYQRGTPIEAYNGKRTVPELIKATMKACKEQTE